MPERLDPRELSSVIRKLVSSIVNTDPQISLSDKLSQMLDEKGCGFLGVIVSNYPEECAEELKYALKASLRKCILDGRNMWIHEEEIGGSYEEDEERFERYMRYRSSRSYNALLIYDRMSRLGRRDGFHSIDFMALVECERMARSSGRVDRLNG